MLTRKPSAAAPAAYPTGKEGLAATPPPAPAPAGTPRGSGPPLPARAPAACGTSNKVRAVAGPRGGRRAPDSASLIVARRPRGSSEWSPPTRPAGDVPGLPQPGTRRGRRALVGGPIPFPACGRLQRGPPGCSPGPARPCRGVANSSAGARLNFAAAGVLPGGARRGSVTRAPFYFPGRQFLPSRLSVRESGVRYPQGWGGATGSG